MGFQKPNKKKLEEAKSEGNRVNQIGSLKTGEQKWSELRDILRSVARDVTTNRKSQPKRIPGSPKRQLKSWRKDEK